MKIYNMIKKEFELIPTQDVGYNHLMIFKSYEEMLGFDFERFKDFKWTFCSIEIKTSSLGKLAVCGVRKAQGSCYFKCNDMTYKEIVEKFLDCVEKEEKDSIWQYNFKPMYSLVD